MESHIAHPFAVRSVHLIVNKFYHRSVERTGPHEEWVALPFVYALLPDKNTKLNREVLQVVREAVDRFRLVPCTPTEIITDFGLVINA